MLCRRLSPVTTGVSLYWKNITTFRTLCRNAMSSSFSSTELTPFLFSPEAVPKAIAELNEAILRKAEGTPTYEELGAATAKALRAKEWRDGDPSRFEDVLIPVAAAAPGRETRTVGARVFFPKEGTEIRGALLHVHGGGYVIGTAYGQNDERLQRHAENCGLSVVSVEYRLAPEYKFPCQTDDCSVAAKWLASPEGRRIARIGPDAPLLLVGESAGANLAASMLPRLLLLREEEEDSGKAPLDNNDEKCPKFDAVALVYGWYDLSELPFFKRWGNKRLVESADDLRWFRAQYLPEDGSVDLKDPRVSPLYADLAELPPALFVVGTEDALLDDSLFMHARWLSSGNPSTLKVYPGAAHGMGHFGPHQFTDQGEQVLQDIEAFYRRFLEKLPS